ncbi:Uncharacterised protein [Legionella beliardensis]|uniref:Uncharacterized protein n=1 Tax=Legionella beliardensis TaxID=91822 RepID=A0A378HZS8_9GAMM|nr:hypothetical protein [Legionella beliardensis]STX27895.1 Uncharacterised protein [Legionella beliardensis]
MAASPNIFDFLHHTAGISQNEALDFIYPKSALLPPEEFVGQLMDFLKNANEKSIEQLNVLIFHMKYIIPLQSMMATEPTFNQVLLGGLSKNDLLAIQDALRDKENGEIVKRQLSNILINQTYSSIPDLLLRQTHQAAKQIESIKKEYEELKRQAQDSPPVIYQVFSKNPTSDMGLSFPSFAEAEKHILNSNDKPDFFIVEIQAEKPQDLNDARQDFVSNGLKNSWPNNQINSVTSFTQGIKEKRHYNPSGSDNVARAIKQLDTMIDRLQQTNWLFKLIETVTGRHGLTDKKIQALTEIRNQVIVQKKDIEDKTISLRQVLDNGLQTRLEDKQESKTHTIKRLLNEQRFGFSNNAAVTTEMVDELVEGIKPSMK